VEGQRGHTYSQIQEIWDEGHINFPGRSALAGAATIGVSVFGDNIVGRAVDFLNPAGDVQDAVEILGPPAAEAGIFYGDLYYRAFEEKH
jgi:hypothetical protein